jgi:branched-chain amino acid transport system substrate-binding protein
MLTRRVFSLVAVSAAVLALTGSTGCEKKSDDLVVGAFLSLSGSDATFGEDTKEGIELAVEELNKAGGIKNKKVKVLFEDDKSLPQEASNKVRQLIDRDNVLAILGEVASSRTMSGGLIANTKKVPLVTPSSTAVEVTKDARLRLPRLLHGRPAGRRSPRVCRLGRRARRRSRRPLLRRPRQLLVGPRGQQFNEHFKKLGGEIVVDKATSRTRRTSRRTSTELESKEPEIVFVPIYYNEMVQIARQAKQAGIPGTMFLGGDGWDSHDTLIDGCGRRARGRLLHESLRARCALAELGKRSWRRTKPSTPTVSSREPTSLAAQGIRLGQAPLRCHEARPRADHARGHSRSPSAETKDFAGATGQSLIDRQAHNANKSDRRGANQRRRNSPTTAVNEKR